MKNKNRIISLALVLLGNILYTLSVKLFLLPANLISCGTTGIALVVNHYLHIPMTLEEKNSVTLVRVLPL